MSDLRLRLMEPPRDESRGASAMVSSAGAGDTIAQPFRWGTSDRHQALHDIPQGPAQRRVEWEHFFSSLLSDPP